MNNRKRVLVFSLAAPPFIGGAEVAMKEITSRLSGEFEFEIISADIKNFWSKYFYPIWAPRLAVRQHRVKKYDLIWAIMANQAGMAAARFKRHFPTVPFLLTLQEGDNFNSLGYRLRLIGPRIFGVFKSANEAQAISHYLARWARQMGATCPITVVPNGVDLEKFKTQNENWQAKASPVIITTSRLVKKNGVDTLIEAMKYLPGKVKLQIVGSGLEAKKLKAISHKLGVAGRIEWLGQRAPAELPTLLRQADIFVRPSRAEGLGNSFLEAMAIGLPVVGTPVGGIPDFLYDPNWQGETLLTEFGQTGWLAEPENPRSVAEKIKFILVLGNQTAVQKVINNARELVVVKYGWQKTSLQIKDIFTRLINDND